MLYLALLPQFIDPAAGSVLLQSVVLGSIQIVISVSVNAMIALAAGSIALFLAQRPSWMLVQRYLMGTVLAGLAVRMAFEATEGVSRLLLRHAGEGGWHPRQIEVVDDAATRRAPHWSCIGFARRHRPASGDDGCELNPASLPCRASRPGAPSTARTSV